ncbi:glycosyltransferase family 2 protein [Nonlabens ponticola]|nr:glycosyltransferase [Nonlabens ponticola]
MSAQILSEELDVVIIDDGSSDGTYEFVKNNYPAIRAFRNQRSLGLMACRNFLLENAKGKYSISLDDDAHILTPEYTKKLLSFFNDNPKCAVAALRIFWSVDEPSRIDTLDKPQQVQSFVGCGHVWNMHAWKEIDPYPEWFEFYGEEDYASYQLFKNGWKVLYYPAILVQHRVDLKQRKKDRENYYSRLGKGIRAGWFLYAMFYPLKPAIRMISYSLWIKLKNDVFKGDLRMLLILISVVKDFIFNCHRFINSNRLTMKEYKEFKKIDKAKIYWTPKEKQSR